jgi:hypothetical protein
MALFDPKYLLGASSLLIKDSFENVENSSTAASATLIIILLIIVIVCILLAVATYKLTNSALQTILCLIFGMFYIVIAYIYYGLAGYKFIKKSSV